MIKVNEALWLRSRWADLHVGTAPFPRPGADEVVIRAAAVAVNPVDTAGGWQRALVYPWLRFPTVVGTDVAGEVVDVGQGVHHLAVGDRVVGLATGQERHVNSAAHGAFQRFVLLSAATVSPIPWQLSFVDAAVFPLGVATASAGLFQADQLGLDLPTLAAPSAGQSVVVWGASSSVGCNAVQLAAAAGYRVIATASPHNHDLVAELGAEVVIDYHQRSAVDQVLAALHGWPLAGVLAIGAGSLSRSVQIVGQVGGGRVASVIPGPVTAAVGAVARLGGVRVSSIWAATVASDDIGPAIFNRYLPAALAAGSHRSAPPVEIVGEGLHAIPEALARLRKGVSARKLVVTLDA